MCSATVSFHISADSLFTSLKSHSLSIIRCHVIYDVDTLKKVKLSHYCSGEALKQGFQPYAPTALTPGRYSWYLFSLEGVSTPQYHYATERIKLVRNPSDTIRNRNRDLPTCSAVPQSTAPPRTVAIGTEYI